MSNSTVWNMYISMINFRKPTITKFNTRKCVPTYRRYDTKLSILSLHVTKRNTLQNKTITQCQYKKLTIPQPEGDVKRQSHEIFDFHVVAPKSHLGVLTKTDGVI